MGARYMDIGHGDGHAILFMVSDTNEVRHAIVAGYTEYVHGQYDEQGNCLKYYGPGHGMTHEDVFDEEFPCGLGAVAQGRICRHTGKASLVPMHGRIEPRKLEYMARRIAKQFGVVVEVFQYSNGWLCQVI